MPPLALREQNNIEMSERMNRRKVLSGLVLLGLGACSNSNVAARIGPDGLPLPQVYNIGPEDVDDIQFRMLDSVNTLRRAAGVPPVELDARLNAAAETHSRDMSGQNRPWVFGSDGSSPLDRARRVGFDGRVLGENISESYETELETLAAWMNQSNSRAVILDREARRMGIAWFQDSVGKLWWTLNMGTGPIASQQPISTPAVSNAAGLQLSPETQFQLGSL